MLSDKLKNRIIKLRQKKYRIEFGEFIVEGLKGVGEAIKSGGAIKAVILDEEHIDKKEIQNLAKEIMDAGTEIVTAKKQEIQKIKTTETFSGIMAVAKMTKYSLDDLLGAKIIIILDGISDPGNLGTIIRTSDWFGIKSILLSENCVDAYNEKVVRGSMGSIFRVKIIETKNIINSVEQLKKRGYNIISLDIAGGDIKNIKPKAKTAYIFGSESHGIRPDLLELSDKKYAIKGNGSAESLNVGVAAGILMSKL